MLCICFIRLKIRRLCFLEFAAQAADGNNPSYDDEEEEEKECTYTFYSSKFEGYNGRDGEIAADVIRKLKELCSATEPELSGEGRMTVSKQQAHPLHY